MSGTSDSSLPILTKFTLEERGEQVEVQPVWLLVHQEHPGGPARYSDPVFGERGEKGVLRRVGSS